MTDNPVETHYTRTDLRDEILAAETALEAAQARARTAGGPAPVLGTHLILGADWQAMFRNSARNLEERRTELFNTVLERVG